MSNFCICLSVYQHAAAHETRIEEAQIVIAVARCIGAMPDALSRVGIVFAAN